MLASSHQPSPNPIGDLSREDSPSPVTEAQTSPSLTTEAVQSDEASRANSTTGNDRPQSLTDGVKSLETVAIGDTDSNRAEQLDAEAPSAFGSESLERSSADQALEAALQEAVRVEAESHGHSASDVEMETSFAPDPTQLAPETSSISSEGEVNSPMYSPVLGRTVPDSLDAESDNYEPPEATPPVDNPSPMDSPPFSPMPPDTLSRPTINDNPIQIIDDMAQNSAEEPLPEQNGSIPRQLQV